MARPKDLTMNVDDQMLVCLEVMARGEDMLPLGTWEAPIKRLAMKEFAVLVGNGYRITDKGRAFFAKEEGLTADEVYGLEPPRPDWMNPSPRRGGCGAGRRRQRSTEGLCCSSCTGCSWGCASRVQVFYL